MSKVVDPHTIKYPDEMPKIDKETFFFSEWINKISTKRKKNQRLFIITDWEFFVLKKKTFSKKFILSYSFRWYDITSIENDIERSQEFTIHFRNDKSKKKKGQNIQAIQNKYTKTRTYFTFKAQNDEKAKEMLIMLYKYLNSFHMPDDLPNFDYSFNLPDAKGSIPNHVRMKLRYNNHRISTSTLDNLKKYISSNPSKFCFTEIRGIVSHLPIFLECIYLAPSITTLIVPFNVNFDSLKILNDFLPDNKTIRSLIFKDKLPDNFSKFKDVFLAQESTKMIKSFKFINSKFTIQNVNELSKIIRNRTIRTLHLKNALGPLTIKPFQQKIYDNPGFQSITTLSLDHTPPFDIRKVLPYLKNVDSLSLIHCEFEIADLFDVLTPEYQMNFLNVSQNKNDKQIFNAICFPKYLSSLVLRDIEWELLSLNNFIDCLMKHAPKSLVSNGVRIGENELRIDLSQLRMPEDYWERFFEGLEDKKRGSVVSLHWDGNPIDERFVSFINSFLNLKDLSLNGCFFKNEKDFTSLLTFISNSESLLSLSFAGTELKNMGITALNIIDTLYVNRSIKKIDVSNHNAGNHLLIKLIDVLIENRMIEEVKFSRNSINSPSLFEIFFIEMTRFRGKPLLTEFPSSFLKSALQFGAISKNDLTRMETEYQNMVKGDQKVKIPQSAVMRKKGKVFNMRNYDENPTQTDYDINARNRRISREKRYRQKSKKVQNQQTSKVDAKDEEEEIKSDVDVDDAENDKKTADSDSAIVDQLESPENSDEEVKTKRSGKKKKRRGKNSKKKKKGDELDNDEEQIENNEDGGLTQKEEEEELVNADSESIGSSELKDDELSHTSKKKSKGEINEEQPLDLVDAENDELDDGLVQKEEELVHKDSEPIDHIESADDELGHTSTKKKKKKKSKGEIEGELHEEHPLDLVDAENDELDDGLVQKEEELVHADSEPIDHIEPADDELSHTSTKIKNSKGELHEEHPLDLVDAENDELEDGSVQKEEELVHKDSEPIDPADDELGHTSTKKKKKSKGEIQEELNGNLAQEELDIDMPSPTELDSVQKTKLASKSHKTKSKNNEDDSILNPELKTDEENNDHFTFNSELPEDFDQNDEGEDEGGSSQFFSQLNDEDPNTNSYDMLMNPDLLKQFIEDKNDI